MFDKLSIGQKYSVFVALILIILTLCVYWPVQNYEFINFDDNVYITLNEYTQLGVTLKGFYWAFTTKYFGLWNPLVWLSFMLDFELFGFNAGGYHWTNVIIHILNTILLFFLFRNLTGAIWRSAFVAALFAIHPVNVESVAWVAERKNVLSTFFWLLTMLFYIRYVKQPNWKRYLPVFISFALGLMSKPMLITLPFVLLLIDYWPLDRTFINTQNEVAIRLTFKAGKEKLSFLIGEKIPLFILSTVSIVITIYNPGSEIPLESPFSFIQKINNTIFSYGMYLKKLFWPTDLSIVYLYVDVSVWQIFLSVVVLIMITILACKYFKKYSYLTVGWFWYLGTLFPVSGIVQIGRHTMADRYAYIPYIGLFIIIAWSVEQISSKSAFIKKILISASVLMILLLTTIACNQIRVWTDTTTLFENAIKRDQKNYLAYRIIGHELAKNGENEKALYYYDMALKANPDFSPSYYYKGLVLKSMGRREEAFENFQRAIQINKFSFETYYEMGILYFENNNFDESIKYFSKAIEINHNYIELYNYLGVAFAEKGKIKEGIKYFEEALRINPNNANARKNLKIVLERQKRQIAP